MRVLIFNWRDLSHPHAGGAEVYTHEVARNWVAAGHEVTIFCSQWKGAARREERDGVKIVRRGGRFTVYRHGRFFWNREGKGGKFDLVIDEVNTRPFLAPRFVRDTQVVALVHQLAREVWHHEFPFPVAHAGRHLFEPHWLKLYRHVPTVTVSKSSAESLAEHGLQNVSVVPEGMSPTADTGERAKESSPTLLFCGRLASNKRPDHAIEAFEMVRRHIPDAKMWVIGSGPMGEKLRRGASDAVTFFGKVSNEEKLDLMSRAHALVATSVREGWGLVVSEAAAVGTPTIGYDVAGLRDSVAASDGMLSEPDPESLAAKIVDVLPGWVAKPPSVQAGGVQPWEIVAKEIMASCVDVVDLRITADLRDEAVASMPQ